MRTRFSAESVERLRTLGAGPHVFVCEPHGPACLHLVFGFAAHGGALPPALAERTLVVAHWIYLVVPLLRNVYAAFGVVDSSAGSLHRALADGYSLALSPSGVAGLWLSLRPPARVANGGGGGGVACTGDDDCAEQRAPAVDVWRRASLGCFAYAARHAALVVPVLSPDEDHVYARCLTALGVAPLVLTLGPWLVRPRLPVLEWRVGRVCHTRIGRYQRPADDVADSAYAELRELGGATHRVVVRRSLLSAAELARGAEE
jgi:hypothetical protein